MVGKEALGVKRGEMDREKRGRRGGDWEKRVRHGERGTLERERERDSGDIEDFGKNEGYWEGERGLRERGSKGGIGRRGLWMEKRDC